MKLTMRYFSPLLAVAVFALQGLRGRARHQECFAEFHACVPDVAIGHGQQRCGNPRTGLRRALRPLLALLPGVLRRKFPHGVH